MVDQIDDLVARSKDHLKLRRFHAFHREHPQILDFLVEEIRLRIDRGFPAFAFNSLWNYARWQMEGERGPQGETFLMNDHLVPFYARTIIILHPELNGRCELRPSVADKIFGNEISSKKMAGDYARRLQWADGNAIEDGWRPSRPHVITHAANRKPRIHAGTDRP